MKPNARGLVITALALLFLTGAQAPPQFARQWPISLSRPDAGAYRIALDADVYAATYWRDLRDVQVIDADGKPVASTAYAAATPAADSKRQVALHWFALPATATVDSSDLALMVERTTDGTVVSVHAPTAFPAASSNAPTPWLIDRGSDKNTLTRLIVDWADSGAALDASYRLEGSDDLRNWELLDPQLHLLQLRNQGQQLRMDSVRLDTSLRYLRMIPMKVQGALVPTGFRGEVSAPAIDADWQWINASLTAAGNQEFSYALRGRFPIQRVDVVMPGNSSARWSVSSRDTAVSGSSMSGSAQPRWQARIDNLASWSLEEAGKPLHSAPVTFDEAVTDPQWKLHQDSGAPLATAPVLRLGYRSGSVIFLAQGRAPYRLVAGSADATANTAALEPLLDDLRARHGQQWQPASATLGAGADLAGAAAYQPAPKPRDWKSLTLWAVLVVGALLVGGLSLSLLRGKPTA